MQATSKEGKEGGIELIQPPANSKPGDRVYFEGSDFEGKCIVGCNLSRSKLNSLPRRHPSCSA
jgi:hypothetical protein